MLSGGLAHMFDNILSSQKLGSADELSGSKLGTDLRNILRAEARAGRDSGLRESGLGGVGGSTPAPTFAGVDDADTLNLAGDMALHDRLAQQHTFLPAADEAGARACVGGALGL